MTDEKKADEKRVEEKMADAKKAPDASKPEEPEEGHEGEARGMPDSVRFPLVLGIVGALSAASLTAIYAVTREQIEKSKKVKVTKAFGSILGRRYGEHEEVGDVKKGGHYLLKNGAGALVAYAAEVDCPGSYNSGEPIQLVVVLDPKLEKLLGARVVKSAETPGLGERVKEPPSARSIAGWIAGREPRKRVVFRKRSGAFVGSVDEKPDGTVEVTTADGEARTFSRSEVEITEAPFPPAFLDQFTGLQVPKAKLRAEGGRVDAITGATVSSTAVTRGVEVAVKLLGDALKK